MKKIPFPSTALILMILMGACNKNTNKPIEGKVKREVISFTPKVTGRVLALYAEEGQLVRPGDTLAMLDVPEVSAKMAQAKGVVKAASAQNQMANTGATPNQIKQLQAKNNALKEQYDFARKSFERADAMFKDSMMSAQQHDEVYAKLQGAKAQYEASVAELNEAMNGVRTETRAATLGQKEQATGVLQEVEIAYSERYIIATNYMQIETITLHEGELATAGYALFNGYIPASTYFRFTIPESEIGKYERGQELTIEIPYNKKTVKGKIVTIKQLTRYADITSAYPDYKLEEAIYELKVKPLENEDLSGILMNATAVLQK